MERTRKCAAARDRDRDRIGFLGMAASPMTDIESLQRDNALPAKTQVRKVKECKTV